MITFFYPDGSAINKPVYDPERQVTGYLPSFFSVNDPRPAAKQIADSYIGGWHPFKGFRYTRNALLYKGDPPMKLLAFATLHSENLRLYQGSWLAIVQPDKSVEIARVN